MAVAVYQSSGKKDNKLGNALGVIDTATKIYGMASGGGSKSSPTVGQGVDDGLRAAEMPADSQSLPSPVEATPPPSAGQDGGYDIGRIKKNKEYSIPYYLKRDI